MIKFKSRPIIIFPKLENVKDEDVKDFGQDLAKILTGELKNIYDDIKTLEITEKADVLPAASADYVGKFILLNGTGTGADTLWIGIDTGNLGFAFKQVSLI